MQLPPHSERSQKLTSMVADMQTVPGASMQVAPPLYTVQGPSQSRSTLFEQYVTIASNARLERSERSPMGLPIKVTSASVFASQYLNSSTVIKLPCPWKVSKGQYYSND